MSVTLDIFYPAVQKCVHGRDTVSVSGATVGECLADFVRRFPEVEKWLFEGDRLLEHVFVYVNAEGAAKAELSRPVKEGDRLILAVLITGG
jgi:molybdopterin converting factor small subunit